MPTGDPVCPCGCGSWLGQCSRWPDRFGHHFRVNEPRPRPLIRSTHTYVKLPVSKAIYDEIRAKFVEAGYEHVFNKEGDEEVIDMQGIALAIEE